MKSAEFTEHQANLARTVNQSFGQIFTRADDAYIRSGTGLILSEAKLLELSPEISHALALWAAKQCFSYWQHNEGASLTPAATVGLKLITNSRRDEQFDNDIAGMLGAGLSMKHAKRLVDDQFFYRYVRSPDDKITFVQAVYHQNGGFFAVIDEEGLHADVVEAMPHRLKTSANKGIHRIYPRERSSILYGARRF